MTVLPPVDGALGRSAKDNKAFMTEGPDSGEIYPLTLLVDDPPLWFELLPGASGALMMGIKKGQCSQ